MRAGGAPVVALLLVSASLVLQVSSVEDLYWEGEENGSNEFLEVKEEQTNIGEHLHRLKRDFWSGDLFSVFGSTKPTTTTENYDSATEDLASNIDDPDDRLLPDDDLDNDGSGLPEKERDLEPREKTLRVTFVVIQPYRTEYSNRDSAQFQEFSKTLADAVNLLFDTLPGTQRASLVRIQSRLDEFTCKVTLDIVTTGYDDTARITDMLRSHIRNRRTLGSVAVNDDDFSANVIDPGDSSTIDACAVDEFRCDDGRCVSGTARCNGFSECADGTDEAECAPRAFGLGGPNQDTTEYRPVEPTTPATLPTPDPTSWLPWATERGDQNGLGETDQENDVYTTTPAHDEYEQRPSEQDQYGQNQNGVFTCPKDELRCDETRCVPVNRRCDGVQDCNDGADEADCEQCERDDFRCDNGKCIEANRRCDRVVDCSNREDEYNCDCREDEFRCVRDGSCIESRKRCDGTNHCSDNSDEQNCACSTNKWQCDHGSCIKRTKRCDGRVDCPTDRSDERNCFANGYFRCSSGKLIPEAHRCNRRYDCLPGDYSDEHNCPCGDGDFKCDNGYCIPASKHCDRTHDCQDGSDERQCSYGTECMAYQYKCTSGQCVPADSFCNGSSECDDNSDERNCSCKRDEFECRDGSCISIAFRCDGEKDCKPKGEDEYNCGWCPTGYRRCGDGDCINPNKVCDGRSDCHDRSDEINCYEPYPLYKEMPTCPDFTCVKSHPSASTRCAQRCDGRVECDGGEDEADCGECALECDGICLDETRICDSIPDCSDGKDELHCDRCDGPTDFRCHNGDCINADLVCNHLPDCSDNSDEDNCNNTMQPPPGGCSPTQFQCRNGLCINDEFVCDSRSDCIDNSDEENCPCDEGSFQCKSGQCIPESNACDGIPDCEDNSDEYNCPTTRPWVPPTPYPTYPPPTTARPWEQPTTARPWEQPTTARPWEQPTTARPWEQPTTTRPVYTTPGYRPYPPRPDDNLNGCNRNEWRCENGPCINSLRRCDGHVDCPLDSSDELDCPAGSPVALNLKTYPDEQSVRYGGDVVFRCRDEGPVRAAVRWVREGGRPLKAGSSDRQGRLEMFKVTPSDSGVYICQAVKYLQYPGSELRVELTVDPTTVTPSVPHPCMAHQATCANGQCIPKSAVCDGRNDCSDGSDEDACNHDGMCEPSEYQCDNRKCVLKTWLCDSADDCGDGSDEKNCGIREPYQVCLPVEFKCANSDQCIPKSFHCDGQTDCMDGTDEISCAPVHVTKPPAPANVRLNPGDTLTLVCEAVGNPIPLISWRLNWGHVPAKCRSSSDGGIGTLTCPNMQSEDSGAYSCEAINNKGTTFAAPDSIVHVEKTDVCPQGFFNSEARSQSDCIRCFCFGESAQCRSADLFTYNMPTPLGEGGTRLVGVKQTYDGQIQIDSQPITNQYDYQPLRNGATVTKLQVANYGASWLYGSNDAHPYLTLPETYNGNQLTSYGGRIKYRLAPHSVRYGSDDSLPLIVIKGKYATLIHQQRTGSSRESNIEARLTPESWLKPSSTGPVPASREDIMMALDNIEMILLRADQNNVGVNITDFAMESAQHINVGLGAASLVEECTCPPGYEGLSCQKCASGFVREKSGPWLGHCRKEEPSCPPGTYGDPGSGYGCRPCPCPLTNPTNQFARTCSIGPNGGVICDCQPGYGGQNCEYCEPGYIGNPMVPGDSCQPKPPNNCNSVGTASSPLPDECQCKENVQGRYCDQCKSHSFYLSEDFSLGCALCFCTGVSDQCSSSNLRRKTTTVRFNTPQIVDQVKIYNSAPLGPSASVKYNSPVETDLKPQLVRGEITLSDFERSRPTIYYWSLPASFAGDKVTSYGGYLRYTLRHVPTSGGLSSKNTAADIQLISENRLTFHYSSHFVPSSDGTLNATVQFLEKGWRRPDGIAIPREHFLLALADVKAILIKATYSASSQLASLESASIDTAEPNGNGPLALHVEQCVCPGGYVGTSCEDCAPGYTRSSSGIYLEHCEPCECNGHSNMCHPETGVCYDCKDNTAGDNCEQCRPGYERNANQVCVPAYNVDTTPSRQCQCDPRGVSMPCELTGYCQCKPNVEGEYCDRCRPGTFGLDESNPLGCIPCYCSGATTDCHEASHYFRIPMAAPVLGDNYGGYSLTDLNAEQVIHDQFVPAPNESELMYSFPFPPNGELFWSLPMFPGNRVLSYGGNLSLKQTFQTGGRIEQSTPGTDVVLVSDSLSLYWSNPNPITSGEPLSYQVPLQESGWFILNTATPASRENFMSVLKNLRRVLVRATLSPDLTSTAIADVSMDSAREGYDSPAAKGVEICMCPEGYTGTSCESCLPGYYQDQQGSCNQCNCNGHDCQLTSSNEVRCNCRPPYIGPDCSTVGGDPQVNTTYPSRPPPPESTVVVTIKNPKIKIQEVGGNVNFTCYARSRMTSGPLPVTWTKVNGDLPQGRSQVDSRTGTLLITNLVPSDSGVYLCQTSDGMSTGQASATLSVPSNDLTVPVIDIMPPINEYYEGDNIRLECQVSAGLPAPRITWQRASNRPLPLTSYSNEGYFYIENAKEEDSGEYRCIASNEAGSTDRTTVVTVRSRPSRPTRDRLTVSPTAPSVTEGQSTRVVCTGTAYVPAGSINWIRQDGSAFLYNVRSDNGVLYIDRAIAENQGVYICQTANSEVPSVPVVLSVVLLGPAAEPSNITVSDKTVKIPTGETQSVDCFPHGYPLPRIKWRKYQGEFGPGTSQRDNTLIISNAQEDDRGYYLCEGIVDETPVQSVYVYVDIEKREPPVVQIWPQGEQAVALGSQFEFYCRVLAGVPEPDVMWDRGGGRLLSTYTHLLPQHTLRFDRIDVNDEGEYTCSATNVAGTNSASAVLKVRSPPEITITPSYVQAVQGEPINIECRASGYPEPMVSIKSANDYREIVPQSPGMAALRIQSATESDSGNYICTATSAAATIEESFLIRVDNIVGGPVIDENEGSGDPGDIYDPYPGNNEPSSLIAFEGEDRRIECNASDNFRVEWRRVGVPLQVNAIRRGSALIIYNASKSDSGQYECTAINPYTNEVQQAAYTNLQIVSVPRITLRPKTQTVLPGQSPTVECVVDGDDIIDINWRPVTRALSPRVEIRQSTLIFHQIEVQDAGKYECFARNRYANASAVAEVIVSEETDRETSESHENEQYAHAGAAVHLSCNAQPNHRIRWTKDGRNVPRSVRQKSDGSLFIKLAQKSDTGHYECFIQDQYGRKTSNYINLHIEGIECLESQFRCLDDSGCIDEELLCDEFSDCQDHSDEENCLLRDQRLSDTLLDYYPTLDGVRDNPPLVSIDQPRRAFRVGENVEVLCRANARGTEVTWNRFVDQQQVFLETRTYRDGSMLVVSEVQESDAGVYRCTGRDPVYGRTSYEDFNLEVQPVSIIPVYPNNEQDVYTARLGSIVDLPCNHNLDQPVVYEWRKEYSPLPSDANANEHTFHIDHVTESDAGTYICRVSNSRDAVEARAILRVEGVVPRFDGNSWIALPTLKDAYTQFDIEISFKPTDEDGLILYTRQNEGSTGDYLALQLVGGVPQFILDTGFGPVIVNGDRPLERNSWHTIRVSRTNSKVTMDVDNTGPFVAESSGKWDILELRQPLYIGGVPDYDQLPSQLNHPSGFYGCISMLILGREEKNIIVDSIQKQQIRECDSCLPNSCLNNGVCQEARNERGYMCLCPANFAGLNCDRTGDACRPGLCGPGKCTDTDDGYQCACPVPYAGRNCDVKQSIEYPAFTGSAYLAIKAPNGRLLLMSMKIKATAPVTDGIIMYCAESARGHGGFTSLAVHDGRLEFRYDLGDGSPPVVLTSNRTLPANEWTDVQISRIGTEVKLKTNLLYTFTGTLSSKQVPKMDNMPMFVGGVDDSIILNNNTGVTGGFNGCIKDVKVYDQNVDIVNSSIQSANVQECSSDGRGDIPEDPLIDQCQCRNGGRCSSDPRYPCICPSGFTGQVCEIRLSGRPSSSSRGDPCAASPCRNGGTCKPDSSTRMNYTCDCPMRFAGTNCQMPLELLQSVGFNGNGYLELPANRLHYERLDNEPVVVALAFHTTNDGVLLYQREASAPADRGDFILLRVEQGHLIMEWDLGSGFSTVFVDGINVMDGDRHEVIAYLNPDRSVSLSVDRDYTATGYTNGISTNMNADSNVYIGGIPERFNVRRYPGLTGCIEQIELMDVRRGLNLNEVAVAGRNPQRCREPRSKRGGFH